MVILMNFWKSMKRMEWRKTDEQLGIAVLRFSDEQILKDMEMWYGLLSFIFGSEKHPSLSRELEYKKEVLV
jgi:hypothetical protein